MADNRMYLVHRPTGLHVYLGRQSFGSWEIAREVELAMENLFIRLAEDGHGYSSDFGLALENTDGVTRVLHSNILKNENMVRRDDPVALASKSAGESWVNALTNAFDGCDAVLAETVAADG